MKIRNINFRQTGSERSGQRSYKNFARFIKEKVKLQGVFKKYGKN